MFSLTWGILIKISIIWMIYRHRTISMNNGIIRNMHSSEKSASSLFWVSKKELILLRLVIDQHYSADRRSVAISNLSPLEDYYFSFNHSVTLKLEVLTQLIIRCSCSDSHIGVNLLSVIQSVTSRHQWIHCIQYE